ncbi:MAG: ShlB/FhaC/HecB family hemolysin secretion/activation protein, partial [Synechococcaceae cyanobacterium RL_1_2]|nr:ShlB/FhaC/HecB family hemolysin secretion/activation protein [Synechococcaceae cyanobacterium RL_1_2]
MMVILTSRAAIVEESLATGAIQLLAIEGEIEDIIIEGNRSVNATYIRDRVALGIANPLNSADLEDQLRLLRSNPLFNNVEANLKAGSGLGQSILRVKVDEAKIVSGNVSVDSYSPPSIGSERMEVSVINRNLTGSGDSLSALYQRTTAGVPINLTLPIIIRSMLRGQRA